MRVGKRSLLSRLSLSVCSLLLAACGGLWGGSGQSIGASPTAVPGTPTLTPFQPEGFTPPPAPTETQEASQAPPTPESATSAPATSMPASPVPAFLWIAPYVPEALSKAALSSGLPLVATSETATARLDILPSNSASSPASIWIYALVTPFPTLVDGVSMTDISNAWSGQASGSFSGRPLWMDPYTKGVFSALWGEPAAGSVKTAATESLIDSAWADQPAWAIVPFEQIEPRWKVLTVDGQSPLHNDFDLGLYPLKVGFSLQPGVFSLPPSNRDTAKLTVLTMTGVTALVRATADRMEHHGLLYPAEVVRDVLRQADITHISNEVSFDENCPVPEPWTESMLFCSNPRYIALLEDIGVDVIELTGNHLLDYGPADFSATLDMYAQHGWKVFGGGRNLQASTQPVLLEHNGNKLVFLGCNFAGPPGDWATDERPGSAPCDFELVTAQIAQLRSQGYLPIMTLQYSEYYQPDPTYEEKLDFRRMADAGAVIVSGSQAHEPAAMEFSNGAFIHYGLGNLFFDQMFSLETRQIFVDRHVFYAGKYIGSELLTYINEDYARPRQMTEAERIQFLERIFGVSGW
jgi:hypothetical protein